LVIGEELVVSEAMEQTYKVKKYSKKRCKSLISEKGEEN